MIAKVKSLCARHREVLMYLIFGFLTTVVGWSVYYVLLFGGRAIFDIPADETTSVRYLAWVFTHADKSVSVWKQLVTFAGGRIITLGIDYVITFGLTLALGALIPAWTAAVLWGKTFNLCELISKLVASVAVIISNYVVSKLFVFKNKKEQ